MSIMYSVQMGLCISFKISTNYAIEFQLFAFNRSFKDGITFLNARVNLDTYEDDHKPSFDIELTVLNCFNAINIYNVNHVTATEYEHDEYDHWHAD